ncbi:MAG: hypothetical protein QOE93_755 [Actinomycetota bacterium]|nr:hypothetical protein [Actinomycetota bacterium]
MSQVAVTHGPFEGQSTIIHGPAVVITGCPSTLTRGLGDVGWAWPPWAQTTAAPRWTMEPDTLPPSQSIARAPLFTDTVGPIIVMLAPLPLLMEIPASLTTMVAPDTLLSMIPPAGPGASLITTEF